MGIIAHRRPLVFKVVCWKECVAAEPEIYDKRSKQTHSRWSRFGQTILQACRNFQQPVTSCPLLSETLIHECFVFGTTGTYIMYSVPFGSSSMVPIEGRVGGSRQRRARRFALWKSEKKMRSLRRLCGSTCCFLSAVVQCLALGVKPAPCVDLLGNP